MMRSPIDNLLGAVQSNAMNPRIPIGNGIRRALILLTCALIVASGCRSPIGVEKVGYEKVYRDLRANALDQGVPSEFTSKILHFLDLTDSFDEDPEATLRIMHDRIAQEGRRPLFFAISELSYITAQRTGNREHFMASAVYAYLYLFGDEDPVPPDPYSFAFRGACDLYNRALGQALLSEDGNSIALTPGVHVLPTGRLALESTRPGFPWGEDQFSRFLPADVYSIRGLSLRVRDAGLGVPVIAVPTRIEEKPDESIHTLAADVPATVFLRLKGGIREMGAGTLSGALELYSSFDAQDTRVADKEVPLETDLTASLAHSLEGADIWSFDLAGLFSGGMRQFTPGIYMVQPYSPDKIPVVFVHGTSSSPTTWFEMFNWLRADRVLRQRCQFWFFLYPSGSPIAYSGQLLRKSLREVLERMDPAGEDAKLRDMVVVGHSQGGLLTRLTVVDSGDRFWAGLSDRPLDEIEMTPEQREIVSGSLFFEHLPFVKRVVYIATPHQGSFLAGNWLGRIARIFVELPQNVNNALQGASKKPGMPKALAKGIPTSLDNMTPGNHFLNVLKQLQTTPGVHEHSIIAVDGDGDPREMDDGLVTYESAHLEGVESETVVRSFHTCLSNPHVIDEVRRILLLHVSSPRNQ
jgi:pimeloyl-ACP methyl ester carboxylesterase